MVGPANPQGICGPLGKDMFLHSTVDGHVMFLLMIPHFLFCSVSLMVIHESVKAQ